ncbi:MAG: alpha/beta hydrolase-fold protein [Chitinophagales bacterium]|jgi:metallo-beta-lactamase class B
MKHISQSRASSGYVFQSYQLINRLQSFLTLAAFVVCFHTVSAQLTIKVTAVPANTPAGASIFLTGPFNGWNMADPLKKLTPVGNGVYMITFNPTPGVLEYKFSRGSLASLEGNINGAPQPNHLIFYNGQPKTVEVVILSWPDLLNGGGTITPTEGTVSIVSSNYFIPELSRTRRIWIYLPPSYGINPGRRYPVLYMQDGQNLFDPNAIDTGDWMIDESMDEMAQDGIGECIIVGIDHGGVHRINEYAPWINPIYGGGEGVSYVNFIVNTLKPYIDNNYLTVPGREHTGIMGSAMGGLISMYALIEHQHVFSKAGIFSPSFWFNGFKTVEHILSKGKLTDVRVYFLAGGQEPPYITNDMEAAVEAMLAAGFSLNEINVQTPSNGQASEWFWAQEFPTAYQWLFGGLQPVVSNLDLPKEEEINLRAYPNPTTDWIRLLGTDPTVLYQVEISDLRGNTRFLGSYQGEEPIWTGNWSAGTYLVRITNQNGTSHTTKLVHL